jgi:flagellar biosynthesis protein FlhF
MKMKMFQGSTVEEAMALVRAEFGADAVILSTRDEDGRVEIRAAIERSFATGPVNSNAPRPLRPRGGSERIFPERGPSESSLIADAQRDLLSSALSLQGAPDGFVHMVSLAGVRMAAGSETSATLAAGLDSLMTFNPIHPRPDKSLLLVGAHGAGKTTAAAKLALQMSDRQNQLEAIAADFDFSGQAHRLAALMLKPTVTNSLTPEHLARLVRERESEDRRLVIDAPPFNPLDDADMRRLSDLISRLNVEPVLVLSAEGHPLDIEDNARAFAQAGCRRVILTKIDAVRRRGGAIAAISSARLSIAQLGLAPSVRGGLVPASSERIARLLLADAPAEAELLKGAA